MLADLIAESRCEVLLIPVSLFQSVIVGEPGAAQCISRTIAERFKQLMADPSTATAALRYGVRDKSVVRVRVAGDRELIFGDALVRVDPNFSLAMHIDTDEGNAANLQTGAQGFIDGIQGDR